MSDRGICFWLWGYVLDTIPGKAAYVNGTTNCSLETGADYLGCDNVMWMNSLHTMDQPTENQYQYLTKYRQVICGLTHLETKGPGRGGWEVRYVDSARKTAEFSRIHKNITGVMLDDFRSLSGPSRDMTVEELRQVHAALKQENPDLKLYVVMYHTMQSAADLLPFKDFFDGVSIWNWNSSDYFWNHFYDDEIADFRKYFPDKELIQGQFIHAFGDGSLPQPLDQLELQCEKIVHQLERGNVDGWCVIQNGFLCRESHRKQTLLLHDYWDWYRGTRTCR